MLKPDLGIRPIQVGKKTGLAQEDVRMSTIGQAARLSLPLTLLAALAMLSACGGGGSSNTSSTATGTADVSQTLVKYADAKPYTGECVAHKKTALSITAKSDGTLLFAPTSSYYDAADCTGAVVGTETLSEAVTAIYLATGDRPVTGYPTAGVVSSQSLQLFAASTPAFKINLTGSGVFLNKDGLTCVAYTGGSTCLNSTSVAASVTNGAFFEAGGKLYLTYQKDSTYLVDGIYSKS